MQGNLVDTQACAQAVAHGVDGMASWAIGGLVRKMALKHWAETWTGAWVRAWVWGQECDVACQTRSYLACIRGNIHAWSVCLLGSSAPAEDVRRITSC